MSPFVFEPVAPWICLALTVLAVPLAMIVRRLGSATRRHRLPPGWSAGHAAITSLTCIFGLIAVLMSGPVLEWAATRLLPGAGLGRDLSEPATWTAGAAALQMWLSLQAWRLLLLIGPLLFALARVAELRWTPAVGGGLALVAALPLAGVVVVSAFPPTSAANSLAAALLLWGSPLYAGLLPRLLRLASRRFQVWRNPPTLESTRVSSMPAALAATLHVGEGRTTGFVRVSRKP